jgi:hypothetical protein
VAKLRHARDRKRATVGRCEGCRPVPVEVISEARRLARKSPKTGQRRSVRPSLRSLPALGMSGHRAARTTPVACAICSLADDWALAMARTRRSGPAGVHKPARGVASRRKTRSILRAVRDLIAQSKMLWYQIWAVRSIYGTISGD